MDVNKYYLVFLTLLLSYKNVAANNETNTVSGSRRDSGNIGSSSESGSGSGEIIDNPKLDRRDLCPSNFDNLKNYLCHSVRAFIAEFPGGGAATYFLDKFFKTGNAPNEKWNAIKPQVENYVADQIDNSILRTYVISRNRMIDRVKTCEDKINPSIKRGCYIRLQEALSGFQAMFTGTTDKERALYFKYYEFFVTTFLSVSDRLIGMGDAAIKRSIRRDVRIKAAKFQTEIRAASLAAQNYGCRIIKIDIERAGTFSWYHLVYKPDKMSNKRSYQPVKGVTEEGVANKRKGCGPGKKSANYRSRVYNSDKDQYLAGPWFSEGCSTEEGILYAEVNALPSHSRHWMRCRIRIKREFLKNVSDRLTILGRLALGRRRG